MDRAKVSGSLELPPELLEVMEHLQQGTASQSSSGLSRSSSMRRSHSAGSSKVRGTTHANIHSHCVLGVT